MRAWLARLLEEADARQLPALIAEWGERSDALRWVAIALQLDLPLLIERPELVMPCLVRRCGAFDHDEAYADRAEIPADATEVRGLVDMWLADWEPNGPWLRAVRPPRYPLEAGIVEEYRTSLAGELRFSDDDQVIGIVGKAEEGEGKEGEEGEVVGWERATGRRIDARDRLARAALRWAPHTHGARELVAGDRAVPFVVRDDETPGSVVELDEDLVIVSCTYEDDPYDHESKRSHYLIDTEGGRGRVVWRAEGGCYQARRIGDRIYMTDREGVVIRDAATGVEHRRFGMLLRSDCVFSSTGLLAERDEAVIRVWDLDRAPARVPRSRIEGGVQLSPDGTRAVVGETLIDAFSGRPIAELSFSGRGNWLEGGPPAGCFEVMDDYAIEVMPWGAQIWSTETGQRVAGELRELCGGARDAVCHDPNGRYVAIYRGGAQTISVYDVPAGTLRYRGPAAVERTGWQKYTLRFDDAGEVLWWRDPTGAGWVLDVGDPREPERWDGEAPESREVQTIACRDGVLVVGEAVAPVDCNEVVVTDGGYSLVGATDHYRLRERLGRGGVP